MSALTFPAVLEHAGVAVSAISGVLAAKGKHIDLFGVLVLALVTAFGGGSARDLLVGDTPVAWLRGPGLLGTATATALVTFFGAGRLRFPRRALIIADAFALAFFTIIGARKGITFGITEPGSVLLGVMTGVAGGILRDVLTRELPLVFRPEIHLYATAAIVGAAAFVFSLDWLGETAAMLAGTAVVLVLRFAAMRWKISLPVFSPTDS